jgi:hypothetical protein
MLSARMVELIQNHAPQLTSAVLAELTTNERTPSFHKMPLRDLEARIFRIYNHLGDWISAANERVAQEEFEYWGRQRQVQGVPLSEIVYAVILLKRQLSRYVRDNGLIESSLPRVDGDALLPVHLHSLQELNQMMSEFFDMALYNLARGYEAEAKRHAAS